MWKMDSDLYIGQHVDDIAFILRDRLTNSWVSNAPDEFRENSVGGTMSCLGSISWSVMKTCQDLSSCWIKKGLFQEQKLGSGYAAIRQLASVKVID